MGKEKGGCNHEGGGGEGFTGFSCTDGWNLLRRNGRIEARDREAVRQRRPGSSYIYR